jgi:hypothetical protein
LFMLGSAADLRNDVWADGFPHAVRYPETAGG